LKHEPRGEWVNYRKTILLVDDVRLFLEVERSYLDREDCQIVIAQSGMEALKMARYMRPDLVIMDLEMPEMDGAACCMELKQDPELWEVPIVLIANAESDNEQRCREAGCEEVLLRPLNRRELLEVARRYLRLAGRNKPRKAACLLVRYGVEDQLALHDYTINLSHGGLFLETSKVLPIETPLTMEFIVPGSEEPILCKGRVAWVNQGGPLSAKPNLPCGFGVEFNELSRGDLERLTVYLKEEIVR